VDAAFAIRVERRNPTIRWEMAGSVRYILWISDNWTAPRGVVGFGGGGAAS
jgi:hypothetical protein